MAGRAGLAQAQRGGAAAPQSGAAAPHKGERRGRRPPLGGLHEDRRGLLDAAAALDRVLGDQRRGADRVGDRRRDQPVLAAGEQHGGGGASGGEGAGAGAAADGDGGEGVRGGGAAGGEAADGGGGAGVRQREADPAGRAGGAREGAGAQGTRHQKNQRRHARDHLPFLQIQIPAGALCGSVVFDFKFDRIEFHLVGAQRLGGEEGRRSKINDYNKIKIIIRKLN